MSRSKEARERERVFFKLFLKPSGAGLTEEEVAYFREHPDQIDEVTAPVNVHKLFLWAGALLGTACVGLAKIFDFSQLLAFMSAGYRAFVVDIVFEIGVALIGAAVTAYILGILLNQQQDNAATWRAEIRRRIEETE